MPKVKRVRQGYECLNIYSPGYTSRGEFYTEPGTIDVKAGEGYTFSFWHKMQSADSNCVLFRILDSQNREVVSWETDTVAGGSMGGRCGGSAGVYVQARHTDWINQPSGNHTSRAYFPDDSLECVTDINNPVNKFLASGGGGLNEWNHWVFTWDGVMGDIRNTTKLYVNGKQYSANQYFTSNGVNHENFDISGGRLLLFGDRISIGNSHFDLGTGNHNVYNCAFWNIGLTDKQVEKLYSRTTSPINMKTSPPTGYWRMRSQYFTKRNYPWSKGASGLIIHHRLKAIAGPDLINQSNQGTVIPTTSTTHDVVTDDSMPFEWDEDHYSGITSGTPQSIITKIDSLSGQYPTISRTGDPTRRGNYNINFDDTNVINFIEGETEITYPQLLKPYNKTKHHLLKQDGAISPHNTIGSITATANVNPNLTSNYSLRGDRKLISDRNNSDLIVNGEAVAGSTNVSPFIDSRINLETSAFYMTGTATSTQPGFESRLHDKTQIKLTLPNTREEFLTRSPRLRNNILDSGGDFYGEDKTGFVYYNWNLKRWEQIGLIDPATQNSIHHDFAVEVDRTTNKFVSGTNNFPMQFYPTPQNDRKQEFKLSTFESWPNAGYPHINSFAPLSTKYYATSSQTFLMSDHINAPFLLEKVVISFPYTQRRTHTGTSDAHNQAASASIGQAMHQADYVFFMYRQDQKSKLNSVADVSGSDRHLIVSGCMSFYNNKIVDLSTNSIFTDNQPLNSPAFSIDHSITSESSSSLTDFSELTGVAKLELIPAAATEQVLGGARIPSSSLDDDTANEVNIPQYYWPGGTSYRNFGQTQYTGRSFSEQVGSYGGFFDGADNNRLFDEYDITDFHALSSNLSKIKFFDTRINSLGGNIRKLRPSNLALIDGDKQTLSPYLLLPEDRLVFGIDNPMALHNNQDMNKSNELTGSFLKLRTDMPVEVTLYGSKVRANKEFHDTLNQNLTTLQVHEGVYQEQPLDQFLVATEAEYSGSYMDTHVTGGVGSIAKSIIASGENVLSASIQRFRGFNNKQQRFFDTVLPSVEDIFIAEGKQLDNISDGGDFNRKDFKKGSYSMTGETPTDNSTIKDWLLKFPFEPRSKSIPRKISQKFLLVASSREDSLSMGGPGDFGAGQNATFLGAPVKGPDNTIVTDSRLKGSLDIFFSFGKGASGRHIRVSNTEGARYARPAGMKYGLLNFNPQFTKNIYRGDKFGQRADMLEQSQDSRFLIGTSLTTQGPIRIRFVVDDDDDDQYIILDEDEITTNTIESSNLSIYATSSLPFFDEDTPKNRNYSNTFFANRVVDIIGFNN